MASAVMSSAVRAPLPLGPFSEPGRILELPRGVVPGSRLEVRPAPATVPSGIAELDALIGGLPRGALSEVFGPASSGRTSMILAALAAATCRQEVCALVDAGDSLHPQSAAAASVDLQRLLWIRCGAFSPQQHRDTEKIDDLKIDDCRLKDQQPTTTNQRLITNRQCPTSLPRMNADKRGSGPIKSSINHQSSVSLGLCGEPGPSPLVSNRQSSIWDHRLSQVLKTTDLLLQSGGFGMVVVDLADVPPRWARRIPLASWFRFRRAVENTPTVLLVVEQEPYAKTCASLVLQMLPSALSAQPSASRTQDVRNRHLSFRTEIAKTLPDNLPPHAHILRALPVRAEIVHDRFQRKPVRSAAAQFTARASWMSSLAG